MGNVERRLAAILALDVVGFSRMMGADEAGTLERLKAIRADIIDPAISNTNGRIVKLMGDGMLVEFDSAVNAVQCAIDAQKHLHRRNEELPEAEAMRVRMGINLGDVIIEGEDIYGDGVNVAARLEALADTGGIFVSASVQDSVQNKVSAGFEDLGEQQLKNIDHPVRVYRINIDGVTATPPGPKSSGLPGWMPLAAGVLIVAGAMLVWTSTGNQPDKVAPVEKVAVEMSKPMIAVLPFDNFSDDKDQEYFSDGLTEDLITDISKVSGVRVISRNSTFSYKGQSPDVREVGKALGATHVVEGSVRKAGGTVRITVQLIDATDGSHVWAERYDRELKDIFAIQDEVIGKIIAMLSVKLTPEEKVLIAHKGTENLEAYDLFMRGRAEEGFFNKDSYVDAQDFYERAIQLDANYAAAHARLSFIYALNAQFGWVDDRKQAYEKSLVLARKAVRLDPSLPIAHYALARTLGRPVFADHEGAIKAFEKSIDLDPNFADGLAFLALEYTYTGDAARAIETIEKAMRINPVFPFWYFHCRGQARYLLGDYAGAIEDESTAAGRNPTVFFVRYWLAAALAQAGRIDDAEWQYDELIGMGFDLTLKELIEEQVIQHPPYRKKYEEGLIKAGFE